MAPPDLGEQFFVDAANQDASPSPSPSVTPPPLPSPVQLAPNPAVPPAKGDLGESFFEQVAQEERDPNSPAQPQPRADGGAPASGGTLSLPTGIDDAVIDPQTLGAAGEAAGLGVAKGVFATKDFFATAGGLFSDPPTEGQRSAPRQWVDAQSARLTAQDGTLYSLTEGLAQGAVGLLGVGKLTVGGAVLKASVGAVGAAASFEPHAANFANLAQNIPGMDGPVARFFASDDRDTAAIGYMKNALASIGVEGLAASLFAGTAGVLKAMRSGDAGAVEAASAELSVSLQQHLKSAGDEPSKPSEIFSASSSASSPSLSDAPLSTGELASSRERSIGLASPQPTQSDSLLSSSREQPSLPSSGKTTVSPGQGLSGKLEETPLSPLVDADALQRAIDGAVSDQQALIKHGSWDAAIANGHTFGGEDGIPWQITSGGGTGEAETSLDAWTARVRDVFRDQFSEAKGGAVQTDEMNQRAVEARVALWNEDPAQLLGALQTAGQRAGDLRADMMAGFTIAQRLHQDAFAMASRIKIGALDEWGGSQEAAWAALQQRVATAIDAQSAAQSISSNAGRALRGLRADFRLTPEAVRGVNGLGPMELGNLAKVPGQNLVDLLTNTGGDPLALSKALRPAMVQRVVDGAQLFLVNNLISNPITHAVIFGSNLWQMGARPAMRMAGAAFNGSSSTVGAAAAKSYYQMAVSVPDAFRSAVQAFRTGDSIIAPHDLGAAMGAGAGGSATASGMGQAIAQAPFRECNSIGDVLSNVLLAAAKMGTFPTRAVGFQDELMKQIVYRGNVSANALVEGAAGGLAGDELNVWVKGKLYDSFDAYGRATDMDALKEAATATYQNELNPTGHVGSYEYATQGYKLQQYLQGNPLARIIIPFVRTPVNLFRQGVQLTPGLNLVQAEYRDAMNGVYGAERQALALGQMGMGTLIMGTAATLAYQGLITGNAPLDPKLAAEASQNGWRPHSLVIAHSDGSKTYVPFDRFDPVMMPFAMAADIVNVLKSDQPADQNKAESMAGALGLSLYKALTDKLYLQHINQVVEFALNPDRRGDAFAGGMAANYVPFSSALHLVNPDPVIREANDFVSATLGKVPGFSKDFPARRDWAGDAVTVHKGLWHSTPADAANAEVERLALQQGASVGAPGSKARGGSDLRTITLAGNADPEAAGKNAYDRYQELAGHPERMPGGDPSARPLRQAVAELVATPSYRKLADGAPDTPGTKSAVLMHLISRYREGAKRFMAADSNVRAAELAETQRVASASGYATPAMPTPTNAADGVINRLGKMFGFAGAHAPSPTTPAASPPQPSSLGD